MSAPGDGAPDDDAARSVYIEGGNSESGDGYRTLKDRVKRRLVVGAV